MIGTTDNVVVMVLRALYQALETVLGTFGLKPLWVAYALGTVLVLALLVQAVQGLRGKTKFSLDDDEAAS